jgi:hypothetical protein
MTQEKRLEGKIPVITGGNSWIERFVQEGAYVFITGRCQLDKAVKQIVSNLADLTGYTRRWGSRRAGSMSYSQTPVLQSSYL